MITFNSTTVPAFIKETSITVSRRVKGTSPTITLPVSVKSFESMIPVLTEQFQRACRYMNPCDREEAVQDMLASAFANYKSLVDRELYDNIYSTPLGSYAVRAYRSGRRFYGNRSKDVMDPACQIKGRADLRGHVYYDPSSHRWIEVLIYDRTHDPALIGEFNIDYEKWRKALNDRQRDLLDAFLQTPTLCTCKTRHDRSGNEHREEDILINNIAWMLRRFPVFDVRRTKRYKARRPSTWNLEHNPSCREYRGGSLDVPG